MKKTLFLLLIVFVITLLFALNPKSIAQAAGSPLQISPLHNSASCSNGVFYGPTSYSLLYNGGTITLSGVSDGTGSIYTDDQVDVEVTPDNFPSGIEVQIAY